ncbi:NAD-dependent epimerase/dehydratase family protein [Candidatus Woesearchaeota archaeon]|nr:NAD-dependent epimerase/dehydratase family protein [Candidatus Woesearchaeota archaeon]
MRILVTGGTGLIGSNLAEQLIKEGYEVLITGTDAEKAISGVVKYLQPSFIGLNWKEIGKVDVVFHQAAINDTTNMDREEMFRVNVESSKKLFEEVVRNGCKKIVYASSTAIYGNSPAPYVEGKTKIVPLNPYAESKAELEKFAEEFGKKHPDIVIVGLRYCNVYGPGENFKGKRATMIYQLAQQMLNRNPKIFKDGEQKRDYIYVKDVVRANILASQAKESCVVNCGFGKPTTFNELINILNNILGTDREPEYIENPYAGKYQDYTECDMALAKERIGFVPEFDIERGIKDYFKTGCLV